MRDGCLVVFLEVVRAVGVVVTGIARKEALVVDLERAYVTVVVVRGYSAAYLHKNACSTRAPVGVSYHLAKISAIVAYKVKLLKAVGRGGNAGGFEDKLI